MLPFCVQDALCDLWSVAFPGHPWEGLQADRWMDMGWQRNDPSSDFRGAGLVSLQNHLYMAQVSCSLVTYSQLSADWSRPKRQRSLQNMAWYCCVLSIAPHICYQMYNKVLASGVLASSDVLTEASIHSGRKTSCILPKVRSVQ